VFFDDTRVNSKTWLGCLVLFRLPLRGAWIFKGEDAFHARGPFGGLELLESLIDLNDRILIRYHIPLW